MKRNLVVLASFLLAITACSEKRTRAERMADCKAAYYECQEEAAPSAIVGEESFAVRVSYDEGTFVEAQAAFQKDPLAPSLNQFVYSSDPPQPFGRDEIIVFKLIEFRRWVNKEEAKMSMAEVGYRPATLPELYAFYQSAPVFPPYVFRINALGSFWMDADGHKCLPTICHGFRSSDAPQPDQLSPQINCFASSLQDYFLAIHK